jgi:hypothetical protein
MKNALYLALSILILGNLSHFGLPWWSVVFIAAAAGWFFPLTAGKCFSTAFAAGALLWFTNAFLMDNANSGLLSGKVGLLFQGSKGWHLLIVTGILGGILTGLGAMTGRMARDVFVGSQPKVQE